MEKDFIENIKIEGSKLNLIKTADKICLNISQQLEDLVDSEYKDFDSIIDVLCSRLQLVKTLINETFPKLPI